MPLSHLRRPALAARRCSVSFRTSLRCPHCNGALNVEPLTENGPGALRPGTDHHGPDPQPGEVVRNAQVQPTSRVATTAPSRQSQTRILAAGEIDRQARAHQRVKNGRVCPVHGGKPRRSKFGGLFCPRPDAASENGWCSWRPNREAAA